MKIPGVSFSLKRAIGITALKQKVARKTGIPTTNNYQTRFGKENWGYNPKNDIQKVKSLTR